VSQACHGSSRLSKIKSFAHEGSEGREGSEGALTAPGEAGPARSASVKGLYRRKLLESSEVLFFTSFTPFISFMCRAFPDSIDLDDP
jgi:hypothetical protein